MTRLLRRLVPALLAALALAGCASQPQFRAADAPPLAAVASVDFDRYQGLWYEFARLPNSFERGCDGVTAAYARRPDGLISVVNTCRKGAPDGPREIARGRARIVNPGGSQLKVSFFGPFWGDYWVIDLAPDYSWAIVGEPSGRYLWVLTRAPVPGPALSDALLARVVALGYPASALEFPRQPPG